MSVFHVIARGWLAFEFQSRDDKENILKGRWYWGPTIFPLERWTPCFDPKQELKTSQPIWIELPGLPLEIWSKWNLEAIGNALGTFMDMEVNTL